MASWNAASQWPHASKSSLKSDRAQACSPAGSSAPGGSRGRMAWPSTNANGFTRQPAITPQMQPVRMIRTPDAYVATHDTMPPREQVINTVPTHDMLRQLYQQVDRKMVPRKRDTTAAESELCGEPRPAKTPRAS